MFEDWEAEKLKDGEFAAAAAELEPGYQIARLRIKEGLTQAQLAEGMSLIDQALNITDKAVTN